MKHLAWSDLELFLALTRTTSLREAADALGLDVSTVSRRLSALEVRLDAQLFDRSRAGVTPTPLARALVDSAEEMERAAHALERRAEGFETEIAGEVRLTLTPSVGDLFLAQLFDGFAAALPRVQLVVHVSNEIIDLQRRQADVALRFVRPSIGDLSSRRVARVRHRVLASAKFARGLGTVTSLSQLPWVLPEAGVFRRLAEGVGARAILTTDSVVAQLDLVRAGLAVAVLPTFFEREFDLRGIELKKGAREPPWPETDVWLVTHTSARRVPRISAVASWLTERVPMMVANG